MVSGIKDLRSFRRPDIILYKDFEIRQACTCVYRNVAQVPTEVSIELYVVDSNFILCILALRTSRTKKHDRVANRNNDALLASQTIRRVVSRVPESE